MAAEGKVYLVGAGPGDPGLLTVSAARLLKECDAVVYDRLAPLELVVALPSRIERYYVGKSSERRTLSQEEINGLLVALAQRGLNVVRLKGGDPFMFGRGGEEALYLRKMQIPYEVIPGITAGLAAPAYAGIPVTHRNKSVFAVFLTAHEAGDKEKIQMPWEWLGKARNGTIIGYMGVKQLSQATKMLLAGGMSPGTPAALIERGTTGAQRSIFGTLSDLPRLAEEANISPPALFVIGDVVTLGKDLGWFEGNVLCGKRVMVTRPADQAQELYSLLRSHGAEILPLPTITTAEYDDLRAWDQITSLFTREVTRDESNSDQWLAFTSENGVRYFTAQLAKHGFDHRSLGKFNIAAVGSGTDSALRRKGLRADFIPSRATTSALGEELSRLLVGRDALVIRIRGNLADDRVEKALESAGAGVIPLYVYRTYTAPWDAGMWTLLDDNPPDVIAFTSGSTVTGFTEILGEARAREVANRALVASIGPMTTQIAAKHGIKVNVEAETHSVPGLIEAIVKSVSMD